jgi:hypothetical protein
MNREKLTSFIAVVALLHSFGQSYGLEVLEAKYAGAKLPTDLYYSTSVYDGIDSVYIFGGYEHELVRIINVNCLVHFI